MVFLFAATGAGMCVFGLLYGCLREKLKNKSLVFKALATGMAVILALSGVMRTQSLYAWMILGGLLFCTAADVVLELNFVKGVLVFGCAHICFLAAYVQRAPAGLMTVVLFAVTVCCVLLLFRKNLKNLGKLRLPAFFYMGILTAMVSMAGTVFLKAKSVGTAMLFAGAVCFFVSDCIISFRTIREKQSVTSRAAILILYYGAVYLIAISTVLM